MSKWQCAVCGYIFDGDEAPENVLNAAHPRKNFKNLMMIPSLRWKDPGIPIICIWNY